MGRFDEAIQQYRKTLEINPKYPPVHDQLIRVYLAQHKYAEAFGELREFATDTGDAELIKQSNAVGEAFQRSGYLAALRLWAERETQASKHRYESPSMIAAIYFAAGEKDRGFEWLERAYNEQDAILENVRVAPEFDAIRSDPRYTDLLRRMGLPQPN
jgi:tetratricopeptide (TPR) repeat protein